MGGIIVHDQMEHLIRRREFVNDAQETEPFLMSMTVVAHGNHVPSNVLSAANRVAVPFRFYSWVMVPQRPFFNCNPGCVRSNA
jgi:hypothetical protein